MNPITILSIAFVIVAFVLLTIARKNNRLSLENDNLRKMLENAEKEYKEKLEKSYKEKFKLLNKIEQLEKTQTVEIEETKEEKKTEKEILKDKINFLLKGDFVGLDKDKFLADMWAIYWDLLTNKKLFLSDLVLTVHNSASRLFTESVASDEFLTAHYKKRLANALYDLAE